MSSHLDNNKPEIILLSTGMDTIRYYNSKEVCERLDPHVDNIEKTFTAQLQHIRNTQNQLSPIYPLPEEILSLIFKEIWEKSKKHSRTALTLSHVCRRWRTVACGNATLWSNIQVTDGKFATSCLTNSKKITLTLSLMDMARKEQDLDVILPPITPHYAQVQELDVKLVSDNHIRQLLAGLAEVELNSQQLRRLHLEQNIVGALRFELGAFMHARIPEPPFWYRMGEFTNLDFIFPLLMGETSNCVDMLKHLPKLLTLKFVVPSIGHHGVYTPRSVSIPLLRLQQLHFISASLQDTKHLLESISTPQLTHLKVENVRDSGSNCTLPEALVSLRDCPLFEADVFELSVKTNGEFLIEGLKDSISFIDVERKIRSTDPPSFHYLEGILELFPSLQTICFYGGDPQVPDIDLGPTASISNLVLRGCDLGFLSRLGDSGRFVGVTRLHLNTMDMQYDTDAILSFPNLTEVTLNDCHSLNDHVVEVLTDAGLKVIS
ncbi:hypothetical protein M422DRAFT_69247 [Sphaerobolus stellatus SS14]|uniref:F-box domain-containing protein n=1 Tax=Sphaerobolus stellatus (strain SS14) TaxID=990650 RepID=A0A0C9VJI0_SPHS4|nr:hypothetical protein M422DRAFT_69247 [Sphaerobolus stellatus SS14]